MGWKMRTVRQNETHIVKRCGSGNARDGRNTRQNPNGVCPDLGTGRGTGIEI